MVVDDHPMWRDGVARDLAEAGFDVAATACDAAQALRILPATRPDLVVLDLQLPDSSGVDAIKQLTAAQPGIRVLVLSASGEQRDVLDAVKAGASGYLVKSAARAGDRDTAAGGEGAHVQADRRAAGDLDSYGAEPRPEHAGEAAAAQPYRAGPVRHRNRPRPGRLTSGVPMTVLAAPGATWG